MLQAADNKKESTTTWRVERETSLLPPTNPSEMAQVITSNMVLQAEAPRLFGWAASATSTVAITLSDTKEVLTLH